MITWPKQILVLALLAGVSLLIWISVIGENTSYSVHQPANPPPLQNRGTRNSANKRDTRSSLFVGRHAVDKAVIYAHNNSLTTEHHIFHLNHENVCKGQVSLLIVVCSAVQSFGIRDAIRTTWGSISKTKPRLKVKVLFLLGLPPEKNTQLQVDINQENHKYGDIIQGNFIDDYRNLSVKSVTLLRWTSIYCKDAEYILKTDGDMYINVPVLLQELKEMEAHKFIMGKVIKSAKPVRDRRSKWFTPGAIFKGRHYPTYVSGTAYVLSGDVLHLLLEATMRTKLFWLEDIYITGMCAKHVGASIIDNAKFTYFKRKQDPCIYKQIITGHKMTPLELEEVWKSIHRVDLVCPENRLHVDEMVHVRNRE